MSHCNNILNKVIQNSKFQKNVTNIIQNIVCWSRYLSFLVIWQEYFPLFFCHTVTQCHCAHTMLIDKNLVVRRKSANWCVLQGSPHQRKQKEPGSRKRVWFWIWWHCRIWILDNWKVSFISSLSWSSSWSSSSSSSASSSTWNHTIASSFIIILHNFWAENSLGWLFHNARLSFSKSLQCDAIT